MNTNIMTRPVAGPSSVETRRSPGGSWDVVVRLASDDRRVIGTALRSAVERHLAAACSASSPTQRVRLILVDREGVRRPTIRYVYPGTV